MPQVFQCKNVGLGSIRYSYKGRMLRLRNGDIGPVPEGIYLQYQHKLQIMEKIDQKAAMGVETADIKATEAITREADPKPDEWPQMLRPDLDIEMRMQNARNYLARYGDAARHSSACRNLLATYGSDD